VAGEIERLAQFVALTQWQDVPESVQHHTKLVLLDTLGVMLAGSERPEVRALTARLAGSASIGATVLARGWPVTDSRTAALLNGIAGRSIELCEGLRLVSGQAAMQVLRTGRHRFWGRSLLERACGGWIRAASAVPCALRPQCC
jgi:MmgE/PrpD N-terminal domain